MRPPRYRTTQGPSAAGQPTEPCSRSATGSGCAPGEACGLRLADVDVDRALLVVRGGKFGKTRLVPHGPRIGALLRALRRARAKAAELATAGVQDATAGRRRGRLRRAVNDLTDLLEATRRIAPQTCQRLSGITPDGATRRVSPHDGDARPIAKGRLGKPVEFGYKAQVLDNDDGVVLDHTVERGNPADAPQLAPAVGRPTLRCAPGSSSCSKIKLRLQQISPDYRQGISSAM